MYFASAIYLHRPVSSGPVSIQAGRYVGVTLAGREKQRLKKHLSDAKRSNRNYRQIHWLRSLKEAPLVEVLEWCFPWNREAREKYWIALFRDYGHDLTNTTEGGDGARFGEANPMFGKTGNKNPRYGHKHSEQTRAAISAAVSGDKNVHLGTVRSPKAIAKTAEASRGTKPQNATSRFHNVSLRKDTGKWQASVNIKPRLHYLGVFVKEEDVARAADIFVRANSLSSKLLNFP